MGDCRESLPRREGEAMIADSDRSAAGLLADDRRLHAPAGQRGDALKARVASMMESMSMSCEEPPTNCECSGCSYAREKGGDV